MGNHYIKGIFQFQFQGNPIFYNYKFFTYNIYAGGLSLNLTGQAGEWLNPPFFYDPIHITLQYMFQRTREMALDMNYSITNMGETIIQYYCLEPPQSLKESTAVCKA
jgi:hypothetical protein